MDFLDRGATISSESICANITQVKTMNLKGSATHKDESSPSPHYDRTHTTLHTREATATVGQNVLAHPPHSLDLVPYDFHLFGP